MKRVIWACILSLLTVRGHGQQLEESSQQSVAVEDLDLVSLDNRSNIFYSDTRGNIFKLDASGKMANQYSPPFQGRLNQLDAFGTMVLFLFSADLQQVTLLDSHLAPIQTVWFEEEAIGIVKAAALGNGNIFWLFDEADLSLKKYNYRTAEFLQVQPLAPLLRGDKIQVVEIQERQNLVFINIKDRGLFVFDNQANLIKKHDVLLHQQLTVFNDHVYFIEGDYIHRLNIYSGEEKKLEMPEPSGDGVAVSPQRMVIYSADSLSILPLPTFDR